MTTDNHHLARMLEATRLTRAGHLTEATALIQRTLMGLTQQPPVHHAADRQHEHEEPASPQAPESPPIVDAPLLMEAPLLTDEPRPAEPDRITSTLEVDGAAKGRFTSASYSSAQGTRAYKLFIPAAYQGQLLPLIVMLHGCTQSPDDFAAGTRMNELAEAEPCFVVYPEQAQSANPSRCWNWFKGSDQVRGRGEPALIAGIVEQVADAHEVDRSRVFVAGLSAGGAMALIMAATYPEMFAAVGVHSGLPYRAAGDLPSALAAMKRGAMPVSGDELTHAARPVAKAGPVPTIVFHGDHDTTVNPKNGVDVIRQATRALVDGDADLRRTVEQDIAPGGRRYTRTVDRDASGQVRLEQWDVHGAGHAWSGGSSRGSFTDAKGPDASRAMLRFFSIAASGAGRQSRGGSA